MSALFQRLNDFAWHVSLVMFGENGRGLEHSVRLQPTLRYDALAFAEQIWDYSVIDDSDVGLAVSDTKGYALVGTSLDAAILHQTADPHSPVRRSCAGLKIARAVKEDEIVAECGQHQCGGAGQHNHAERQQAKPLLLAGHSGWP